MLEVEKQNSAVKSKGVAEVPQKRVTYRKQAVKKGFETRNGLQAMVSLNISARTSKLKVARHAIPHARDQTTSHNMSSEALRT